MRSLEVLKIRILEHINEFTSHILEIVNAHMIRDKALQEASGESAPVAPSKVDKAPEDSESHLNFNWKEVLRLIHECPHHEGKSICQLQTKLCRLSAKAIKEAIDFLMVEGHIYPHCGYGAFSTC